MGLLVLEVWEVSMWWMIAAAVAGPPNTRVALQADLGVAARTDHVEAHGAGRLLINWDLVSLDLAAGEGFRWGDQRVVGKIFAGARLHPWRGLHVRGGVAHAHEIEADAFLAAPIASLLGMEPSTDHMSGLEVATGWSVRLGQGRVAVVPEVSCTVYPARDTVHWTCGVDVGWRFDLGRPRDQGPDQDEPATQ